MQLYKRVVYLAALACLALEATSCGSRERSVPPGGTPLDRVAWLGSPEGWGLLGLPLAGGPLTYLGAENLESPTWAPPDLGRIAAAWPGEGAIWLQFPDSRIALYYYPTGHVLNFDSLGTVTETAVALEDGKGLVVADGTALSLVAESQTWRFKLSGGLAQLRSAGNGWVLAVSQSEPSSELVVLQPPQSEPLGRRQVNGVRDLAVTAWGGRLYYISADDTDAAVHGLSLPELDEAEEIALPAPGRAVAVTPSAHRLYVGAGDSLLVFDRLRGELIREIPLPAVASALRFSLNGAELMVRLEGEDRIAVLRVGADSLLGVVPGEWDENLPVALPGGRMIVRSGAELVLYDAPRMVEIARSESDASEEWLAVKWQPPRPRMELTRRTVRPPAGEVEVAVAGDTAGLGETADREASAGPGHYAVVLAARQRRGVEDLVVWLRSVGYPGVIDRHLDVMGVEWFRAMVGPYPSRERAEAAAQSLAARYGYKPWILWIERSAAPSDTSAVDDTSRVDSAGPAGEGRSDGRGSRPGLPRAGR